MIRIASAQMDVIPGQVRINWSTMEREILHARETHVQVLVFPELCLSGYMIGDLWDQDAFLRECETYGDKVIRASRGMTIVFGNVAVDRSRKNDDGRFRKYNAAFIAGDGRLLAPAGSPYPFVIKTLLPNYRQFDEKRYFTGLAAAAGEEDLSVGDLLSPVPIPAGDEVLQAAVLLCEDSWDESYSIHPMDILAQKKPDIFLNLSASPFTLGKNEKRHRMLAAAGSRLHVPMLYVNTRGLQNNGKTCYTFDGMTAAYNQNGVLISETPPYTCPRASFLFDISSGTLTPEQSGAPYSGDMLLPAVRYGTGKFLHSIHTDHVVIGISGGIDSAVGAALYRSLLPAENVLLVNTPTRFNSETTKTLAADLASRLGSPYVTLPIGHFIDETVSDIHSLSYRAGGAEHRLALTGFMQENIQARDRSSRVLAALSAAFGGIFTCNANKTEMSVGYSTLYGDLAGAFAATADLWKHQVYELGRLLNNWFGREVIPEGIFTVKPSAELSDSQAVEKGLGDPLIYEYHDYLLQSFIEPWDRRTPEDILQHYASGDLEAYIGTPISVKDLFPSPVEFIADLEKWWNLFAGFAVAKRIQSPPLLAVSRRPYGYDLRESQLIPYYTDAYLQLKKSLLQR